jgi:hypothetical protein
VNTFAAREWTKLWADGPEQEGVSGARSRVELSRLHSMISSSVGTRGDSIALDLEIENEHTLLEFAAAEDRAFSVGSRFISSAAALRSGSCRVIGAARCAWTRPS